MRKSLMFLMCLCFLGLLAANSISAQSCGDGITYTSSFPRTGTPNLTTSQGLKFNDTTRLQAALQCRGKIIFNENEYYINGTLTVLSYQLIEGTGVGTNVTSVGGSLNPGAFAGSKIVQMANLPIFKIGTNIVDVSIRDLAMIGGMSNTSTSLFGIYAESGTSKICNLVASPGNPVNTDNCASIGFQFSNLHFFNLNKGFYVNAQNAGEWQIDNMRLDHARFVGCIIGIHLNTLNGGLSASSLDFFIPNGPAQGTDGSITGKTYGIFLERSTYTSFDWLVGNGNSSTDINNFGSVFIYVKEHASLTIKNAISEGIREDLVVDGNTRNLPINLTNNQFQGGVRIKDATVYSNSNQYGSVTTVGELPTIASGVAQIYSIGDKFCFEGSSNCDEGRGFATQDNARVIFSSNQSKNTTSVPSFMKGFGGYLDISRDTYAPNITPNLSVIAPLFSQVPLFRLGVRSFKYDFNRSETDGKLEIIGNQNNYSGYSFQMTANNAIKRVDINNDGSIKLGSVTFSELGSPTPGTMVYCADCQEANTCVGSGNGAFAKKLPNRWDCD